MRINIGNVTKARETPFQVDKEHRENRKRCDHEELDGRKPDVINVRAEPVDDHDVACKSERAQEQNGIGNLDGKIALDTEQVKPHDRNGNTKPNFSRNFLAEKQTQNRDENDVARGQEPSLPGRTSEEKSRLLQVHCKEKRKPAEKSCFPESSVFFFSFRFSRTFVEFV